MGTADIDADKLLVDMAVDDSLPRADRAALRERLAGDEVLRREERELGRLNELLDDPPCAHSVRAGGARRAGGGAASCG